MKSIKSKGKQIFNVPNTTEGRTFLKLLRKYRNRACEIKFKARGRGPRPGEKNSIGRKKYYDFLPLELSTWMAVYINPDVLGMLQNSEWDVDYYKEQAKELKDEQTSLLAQIAALESKCKCIATAYKEDPQLVAKVIKLEADVTTFLKTIGNLERDLKAAKDANQKHFDLWQECKKQLEQGKEGLVQGDLPKFHIPLSTYLEKKLELGKALNELQECKKQLEQGKKELVQDDATKFHVPLTTYLEKTQELGNALDRTSEMKREIECLKSKIVIQESRYRHLIDALKVIKDFLK